MKMQLSSNAQASTTDGVNLVSLISRYPIFSSLVEHLDFWTLVQLSRTSATIRAICHGFMISGVVGTESNVSDTNIRVSLSVGMHNTSTWRLYKSLTTKECTEPDHTRGREPLGCKICSKPVCFACIVKHSFAKYENTFLLRGRALCKQCFRTGNPHDGHIKVQGSSKVRISYAKSGLCNCTSQDGILCSGCKKKQNEDSVYRYKAVCAGDGCDVALSTDTSTARVCLWCDSVLPTATQRQQYDTSPYLVGPNDTPLIRFRSEDGTNQDSNEESSGPSTPEDEPTAYEALVRAQTSNASQAESDWPEEQAPAYSRYPIDSITLSHSTPVQV